MKPIRFVCEATLPHQPEQIASQILDLNKWPEFGGFGPLPGIAKAEFEIKTDEIVGTRIQVTNRDGSTHVEEIVEWELPRRLRIRMCEFSPPLSRMATRFDETWEFQATDEGTSIVRVCEMHPKSALARPLLWMISLLLKRAIARHLQQMRQAG